jgi:hypothetical protein
MEWLTVFFSKKKESSIKTVDDYQREALVEQGREQFEKLIEKGLNVPVAHL